jgi:16S rRNA (uracil1498-N3)-methyltransferase
VQVLRLQPGAVITLFNGEGGEYEATVQQMGRSDVQVQVGAHHPVEREAPRAVHLLVGMPANDRMDWLVEKATELGVASIQPLMAERSVLKLKGERAEKKRAHWQGIAVAACEQCGRNRVPVVHEALGLHEWLALAQAQGARMVLSLQPDAHNPLSQAAPGHDPVTVLLSGPEGGLSPQLKKRPPWRQALCPSTWPSRAARRDRAAGRAGRPYTGLMNSNLWPAGPLPGPLPHQQRHFHRHQRPGRAGAGAPGLDGHAAGHGLCGGRRAVDRVVARAARATGARPRSSWGWWWRFCRRCCAPMRPRAKTSGCCAPPPWSRATTTPMRGCTALPPPSWRARPRMKRPCRW